MQDETKIKVAVNQLSFGVPAGQVRKCVRVCVCVCVCVTA